MNKKPIIIDIFSSEKIIAKGEGKSFSRKIWLIKNCNNYRKMHGLPLIRKKNMR